MLVVLAWSTHVGRLVQALRIRVVLGSTISAHFSDLGATDITSGRLGDRFVPAGNDVAFVTTVPGCDVPVCMNGTRSTVVVKL